MRMSTILSVLFTAITALVIGTPVNAQTKEPKSCCKNVHMMTLTKDIKLVGESRIGEGTILGNDIKDIYPYVLKDDTRLDMGKTDYAKGEVLKEEIIFPKDTILPMGTVLKKSAIMIDEEKVCDLPSEMTVIGKEYVLPGDKVTDPKNITYEFILQRAKLAKLEKSGTSGKTVTDLEKKIEDLAKALKKEKEANARISNALVMEIEQLKTALVIDPATGKSVRLHNLETSVGNLDGNLRVAMNEFEKAQKALEQIQSATKTLPPTLPPVDLPAPPATQLYAFPPDVTSQEVTTGGETYVRQPCGRYAKKKVS